MTCPCTCHDTCEPVREYRLLSGHVSALRKLLLAVREYGKNDVHIREEMMERDGAPFQLTYDETNNFAFLRYFGLVHHADRDNPKSGRWLITLNGGRFLRGELAVWSVVQVRRGEVVGHKGERITITHFTRKRPEFSQLPYFNPEFPERKVETRTPAML